MAHRTTAKTVFQDAGHVVVRFSQVDAGPDDLSEALAIPKVGRIVRWRSVTDSGTVRPRLIEESAAAGLADAAEDEVFSFDALEDTAIDAILDAPYLRRERKVRVHPRGTGTGRTIRHEIWIRVGW